MDRRLFLKSYLSLLASTSLPQNLVAQTPIGDQTTFLSALAEKPWLLGYLGTGDQVLKGIPNIVHGKIPLELRGTLFRNGPAKHNIGQDRFKHWFDAPGMLQRFTFSDAGLYYFGKLIATRRNTLEQTAGHMLFDSFGTHAPNLKSGGSADAQNTANTSVVQHAGELLALWEGGSAHKIDPKTLETTGPKIWSADTKGLPFGAHPRKDLDGSLWNIGYSVDPAAIILYHISDDGTLLKRKLLWQSYAPMVHDFMITETKIIIVAPPFIAQNKHTSTFLDRFEWQSASPCSVLVIEKSDLDQFTKIEIDPFWVFHFGNAFDLSTSEVGFDFAHHTNPTFMTKDAFKLMDGTWDGTNSNASCYAKVRLDLTSKKARLEKETAFDGVEFIQIDQREKLTQHSHVLTLAYSGQTESYGFDRLLLLNSQTGKSVFFDAHNTEILEEHLIVPKPNDPNDFWIVGTSLDWMQSATTVCIYEGKFLQDGAIMKAKLDLALPLGLHGTFVPATH